MGLPCLKSDCASVPNMNFLMSAGVTSAFQTRSRGTSMSIVAFATRLLMISPCSPAPRHYTFGRRRRQTCRRSARVVARQEVPDLRAGDLRREAAPVHVELVVAGGNHEGLVRHAGSGEGLVEPLGLIGRHQTVHGAEQREGGG